MTVIFEDRVDAGKQLAARLEEYRGRGDILVLGVPRGGVVVAYEVACALGAPLEVVVPRKIPAPGNPELAIGAVAGDGTRVMDPMARLYPGVTPEYVEHAAAAQVAEIERRVGAYQGGRPAMDPGGKVVIVVDDGIATGNTVLAALRCLRKHSPKELILAVPVAPPATVEHLAPEADRIVVVSTPEPFYAVGEWYRDFQQVADDEVIRLLEHAKECVTA